MKKQIIDPWGSLEVTDYEKLFKQFGLSKIHSKLQLNHYLFKRNIIIAHREFEKVFKRIKSKQPFINMTGIASSGPLHLGHKLDIDLFTLFSKQKNSKNFFAIADIDAYVSRPKINTLNMAKDIAINNIAHALALGIPKNSIYLQSQKDSKYFTFTLSLSKKITSNMFRAVYGHLDVGKMAANLLQYADILNPQLKTKMPSVTCIGLEQDPHAKLTRDLARRIDEDVELPSFIYFKHQGGLQQGKKMSASEPETAIFLDDKIPEVERKITKTFTGGKDTLAEQKKKGGNPDICKIYEIQVFHNPSDKEVQQIYSKCKKGTLLCKECKSQCFKFLSNFLKKHHKKLSKTSKIAKKIVY